MLDPVSFIEPIVDRPQMRLLLKYLWRRTILFRALNKQVAQILGICWPFPERNTLLLMSEKKRYHQIKLFNPS
jgi:hypothetical protein